jgi:hypothetical protein
MADQNEDGEWMEQRRKLITASNFDKICKLRKTTNTARTINSTVSFFLRLAIGFYMLIFQLPVNFCSDENIQTIFETQLEDFLNYRIDYNSISQTVEKVLKKYFLARRKRPKAVEPTMALLWRPLDVLLFRRPKSIFFTTFSTVWDIKL